jgi:hypothetical protein
VSFSNGPSLARLVDGDRNICPACGHLKTTTFYRVANVPVHSVLLMQTREDAVTYPKGTINLALCPRCGFILNKAFDPSKMNYCARYEETQGFSGTFRAFHYKLAQALNERYQLNGKTVIEIGCGKGEFLTLLCETTGARGIGFDPSYIDERNSSDITRSIQFIKDFYSEKYGHYTGDLICCKMTLEHIHDVARFVKTANSCLTRCPQTVVFFQVPDVIRVLRDFAFWDIYYEHCSYFSPGSLARLFRACGLEPFRISSEYDGQYLMIEARAAGTHASDALTQERDLEMVCECVETFSKQIDARLSEWRKFVFAAASKGEKTVLWGGGSKAVAFLTTLGIEREIEFAVDINPHRQDTYLAGSGQRIVPPSFLASFRPDNVILMNEIYLNEVSKILADMGLSPRLLTCARLGELASAAESIGSCPGNAA